MLLNRRPILDSWDTLILRVFLTLCIHVIIKIDNKSVLAYHSLIKVGSFGISNLKRWKFVLLVRWALNNLLAVMISYFIFTIDQDGQETCLDQVKDFTALLILIEIDNLVKFDNPVSNFDLNEAISI